MDRRAHTRHRASFKADLGGLTGQTRDLNASGIYLIIDDTRPGPEPGDRLRVVLHLDETTPSCPVHLHGALHVVRVEPLDGGLGVAARVDDWSLGGPEHPGPGVYPAI